MKQTIRRNQNYFKQNEMASIEIFNNRIHALLGDDFFEVPYNGRADSAAGPPVPHAFSQFCGEASGEVQASLDPFKT